MTDLERGIFVNQAVMMSAIDTLICTSPEITPAIKKMLHQALDEAITVTRNTFNQKDSPE